MSDPGGRRSSMATNMIGKAALGMILAAGYSVAASAGGIPFTWNLSAAYPGLPGPFTADSISMSDFLLNWQAQQNDTFILQINGFSINNGSPVSVPGLGSTFGLYLEGTTKVVGTPSVYGPGSISLVLDPTNNDGTPSATVNLAASTGAVGFSHPLNTGDDITLATGSLTYGAFGTQPNGNPGVHFIETYTPAPGETDFSVSPTGPHTSIEEFLFNTSTSRVAAPPAPLFADGSGYVLVNNGIGTADLLVPEPATIGLLGAGLLGLVGVRRRSRGASRHSVIAPAPRQTACLDPLMSAQRVRPATHPRNLHRPIPA
jgi:hypothetical protein